MKSLVCYYIQTTEGLPLSRVPFENRIAGEMGHLEGSLVWFELFYWRLKWDQVGNKLHGTKKFWIFALDTTDRRPDILTELEETVPLPNTSAYSGCVICQLQIRQSLAVLGSTKLSTATCRFCIATHDSFSSLFVSDSVWNLRFHSWSII
jgi:hypothetical protein